MNTALAFFFVEALTSLPASELLATRVQALLRMSLPLRAFSWVQPAPGLPTGTLRFQVRNSTRRSPALTDPGMWTR